MTNSAAFDHQDLVAIFADAAADLPRTVSVTGVSTDTRTLQPGNAFVALAGEHFNGHDHIDAAVKAGASLIVCSTPPSTSVESASVLVVKNTLNALGSLAWYHRRRFHIPVIAIGGASGKTSTKDLTAHVLAQRFVVLRTTANYNNQIGVPLTLLQLKPQHQVAVIEIGTNEPGEIEILAAMVQPTHGLITTVGPEHLEKLIDLDGVEREETALFDYLRDHGGLIFANVDDERLRRFGHQGNISGRVVTFGLEYPADVKPTIAFDSALHPTVHLVKDDVTFRAPMQTIGYASALNAVAATAIGWSLNLGAELLKQGLSSYEPPTPKGYARMALEDVGGVIVLNDTYNANPESMKLSLKTLALYPTDRHVAVLGDMRELGGMAASEHRAVLTDAIEKADLVIVLGEEFRAAAESIDHPHVVTCSSHHACAAAIRENTHSGSAVLVKGSRGLNMETVIEELRAMHA
jgi:UDP-N-acetylmuramoyl-tripeptide--D-alanyl-D-alanine ligase